jgi:hypothetical protein
MQKVNVFFDLMCSYSMLSYSRMKYMLLITFSLVVSAAIGRCGLVPHNNHLRKCENGRAHAAHRYTLDGEYIRSKRVQLGSELKMLGAMMLNKLRCKVVVSSTDEDAFAKSNNSKYDAKRHK